MEYGYRDITDLCFMDLSTGEIVQKFDYLRSFSQAFGQETVYARGGRGAPNLVAFGSGNSVKFDLESAIFTPSALGLLFAVPVTTGSQNIPKTELITTTSGTFVLSATPVIATGTPITIAKTTDGSSPDTVLTYATGTPGATQFSVSSGTVTLHSTYSSGGDFLVNYSYASTATNKRVIYKSDKFAKAYKVTGYTLWKNKDDNLMYPCAITIPKLQLEIDGATLNSVMEGDPTVIKIAGQALKSSANTNLIIYDIDEGAGFSA